MTLTSIKSILTGMGGTLILALFCTTFLTIEKVWFIMPLFIAFNGGMTGFRIVEVLKDKIRNIGFFSFVMGVGGGAATFSVVNLIGRVINSPFSLSLLDLGLYILVSGVTSYLGARLAVKYFKI